MTFYTADCEPDPDPRDAQIARLTEQVRVAMEGLERIVGDADSYRGDRNEYDCGIEVGMDRQAETARETLTRMEKNDGQ